MLTLLALLATGPPPAPNSLNIQRMSVLEQRSGWLPADKNGQFEAGDCEVAFCRVKSAPDGAAILEHVHCSVRASAPRAAPQRLDSATSAQPFSLERVAALAWKLDDRSAAALHYREPSALPGRAPQLFDGKSLAGWHAIGEASFVIDETSVLARSASGKQNSFLVTNESYGDFLLNLELKNELPGNSGIQIRSRVVGDNPTTSYATGYQIEIDPSPRSWSGGLYEERGRGWLQDLEKNVAGREAFHRGEWNRYRIECIGPWIRAWVNDIPTTDTFDPEALEGIIGLQVHTGQDTRVRFRGLQLHHFGRHAWTALDPKAFAATGAPLGSDFGLRLVRPSGPSGTLAGYQLCFRGEFKSRNPTHGPADELLKLDNMRWSIDLGHPRLANAKQKRDWQELVLLAYADRLCLFRDHELMFESRAFCGSDGPLVWIERPAGAGDLQPFVRAESIEPITR